jgi:hypothetical protein
VASRDRDLVLECLDRAEHANVAILPGRRCKSASVLPQRRLAPPAGAGERNTLPALAQPGRPDMEIMSSHAAV